MVTSCPYSPLAVLSARVPTSAIRADSHRPSGHRHRAGRRRHPGSDRAGLAAATGPQRADKPGASRCSHLAETSGRRRGATTNVRGEPGRLVQKPPPIIIRRPAPAIPWLALASLAGASCTERSPSSKDHLTRGKRPKEPDPQSPRWTGRGHRRDPPARPVKTFESAWSARECRYAQNRRWGYRRLCSFWIFPCLVGFDGLPEVRRYMPGRVRPSESVHQTERPVQKCDQQCCAEHGCQYEFHCLSAPLKWTPATKPHQVALGHVKLTPSLQ
jgi:hypothetical protein